MSFGFGVGDFIAGANLAHKLIRVMTETRGASAEFQEALAEVCGIQQIFIQLTQLCRSEVLPRATLNSIAQIVMPSMTTIADFLDRTKHYQEKLSPSGGLSGSWCKIGWALFRKDELKLLRDTLHTRLSSINTLLTAANHLPPSNEHVTQYQVQNEDQETQQKAEDYSDPPSKISSGYTNLQEQISNLYEEKPTTIQSLVLNADKELTETIDVLNNMPEAGNDQTQFLDGIEWQERIKDTDPSAQSHSGAMDLVNNITSTPERVKGLQPSTKSRSTPKQQSQRKTSFPTRQDSNVQAYITQPTLQGLKKHKSTNGDLESYLQMLFEKALIVQAEAEAKAAAEKKAAEDAEWKQRMEEVIRIQAEIDIRQKLDNSRIEAENKACVRFKDAVGRKFNFPYSVCSTWQGMEELIKQAFIHVDIIGPHVQAGHYDLMGPSGEIILPQAWSKAVEPDLSVSMHMWPMTRPKPPPPPPPPPSGFISLSQGMPQVTPVGPPIIIPPSARPGIRPGIRSPKIYEVSDSDEDSESDDDEKFSLKGYFGKKLKRIHGKKSPTGVMGWISNDSNTSRRKALRR
ncbi:hypothetical protein F4805DRAFT_448875 [Annulohypoxylon moriforme]|nr:hypothetical protein F4805DRAFT_448875 [Annulohypoxylon moriforme]